MKIIKTRIVMIAAITLSTLMAACNGDKNQIQDDMMENMSEDNSMGDVMNEGSAIQSDMPPMFTSYMEIKDALVADDSQAAKQAAQSMMEISETTDAMKKNLQAIASSEDLESQRTHFSQLSEEMYKMAKNKGMDTPLYWNHCLMAMNDEGANWLSMSEKISNPYMGQRMPGCGSVQETLNE